VLLLDEPTASLDPEHARGLWERVRRAREAGAAAVVATHFLDETVEADRVLTLEDGRLA
jgi:ABC-type multidrug transport system ATPase subunit